MGHAPFVQCSVRFSGPTTHPQAPYVICLWSLSGAINTIIQKQYNAEENNYNTKTPAYVIVAMDLKKINAITHFN